MKLDKDYKCELINKTLENLKFKGRSDRTLLNYKWTINSFFDNCSYKGNLEDFTEDDFLNYIRNDLFSKTESINTYNMHIAAIKIMFLVCFKKTFIDKLIPHAKAGKRLPVIISKYDFIKIFNSEKKLNHKCWLLLSFCCGLRVSEVATIKIENINSKEHSLKIIGKGNKERITILPDLVIKILRIFYKSKNLTKKSGYLFEGTNNNLHTNSGTIINYFTSLKDKYNLDSRYTFHSLRHSFATYFLMNGGNLYDLQHMLGHTSIISTSIYLHLSQNFNNLDGINYEK